MNLIIATSNTKFAKSIKDEWKKLNVNVIEIVTCIEDLVDCLAQEKNVDGILLKTDLAQKNGDHRLEMLSDVVLSIRQTPEFQNLTFTILSDYPEGHPLLAELFEMGIYNFFTRNGVGFTVKSLLDSFEKPMSFSMALKYRTADTSIPWRRNINKTQVLQVNFESEKKKEVITNETTSSNVALTEVENGNESSTPNDVTKESKIKELLSKPNIKIPVPKKTISVPPQKNEELDDDWIFEERVDKQAAPPIVGTVVIGVAAVQEHLGSTNTAITIAKYLQSNGYDVALVEANRNMDFDRIHSLIEGEKIPLEDIEFSYSGIDHIKYRETLDLGSIYTHYQYVVLDIGDIRNSPFREELKRSHIKCIVASSDEWKYHWIEEFLLEYEAYDMNFILPASDSNAEKELASRIKKYDVYSIDKHTNPYVLPEETKKSYGRLFHNYQQFKEVQGSSGKYLLMAGLIGAILTATCFSFYTFFIK